MTMTCYFYSNYSTNDYIAEDDDYIVDDDDEYRMHDDDYKQYDFSLPFSAAAVAVDSLCLACGCGIMMWSWQSQTENAELASSCRGGRSSSAVFPWGDEILVVPVRIQECKLVVPVDLVVGSSRRNSRGLFL